MVQKTIQIKPAIKPIPLVWEPTVEPRKLYEDQYANISIIDAIPCIRVRLHGVPQSSDHFQFVQNKLVECIQAGLRNFTQLHLLTDHTKAGVVLDEDMNYYKTVVVPAMEKAGVRYHAIVLPESLLVRLMIDEATVSTRKTKVEYFHSVRSASKWLRNR
jgi:hypothetical protein